MQNSGRGEDHFQFIQRTDRKSLHTQIGQLVAKAKQVALQELQERSLRLKNMLELGIEKMMDERTADLYQLDICTKVNLTERIRVKKEAAEKCYEILRKQICEDYERRLLLEAEVHENKMLENRFVHPEITHEMKTCRQIKYKADLDAQIVEMKRIQAEEEKKFDSQLMAAVDDPLVCKRLAKEILASGIDYLAPHPNWRVIACNPNKYIPRAPTTEKEFDARVAAASLDKCPCPRQARTNCGFMAEIGEEMGGAGDMASGHKSKTKPVEVQLPQKPQKAAFRNCHCKFY